MKEELVSIGFADLTTPEQVVEFMKKSGTALLFFNSVGGAAANLGRPAVKYALEVATRKPTNLGTVFAEHDLAAVAQANNYISGYSPSFPSIALFKDGELVHFIPRHRIEGRDVSDIAQDLLDAFDEHCEY